MSVNSKPGVIATIIRLLEEATEFSPITKTRILSELTMLFPDRDRDGMLVTINDSIGRALPKRGYKIGCKQYWMGSKKKGYWMISKEEVDRPYSNKVKPSEADWDVLELDGADANGNIQKADDVEGPGKKQADTNDLLERLSGLEQDIKREEDRSARLAIRVKELEQAEESKPKTLVVKRYETGEVKKLKNTTLPKCFERVLDLAECRRNILLIGPAGCGKSNTAELLAKVMGLRFGMLGFTAATRESAILGKTKVNLMKGTEEFECPVYLDFYENGGVWCGDEFDAGDSNVLLCLNNGLADKYMAVPLRLDKPRARRHEDFIAIGTANTKGRGATRMYAGRNQLDEATIDRFRVGIVEVDYDRGVESALCPEASIRNFLWRVREKVDEAGAHRIVSTRFMSDCYIMHTNKGWDVPKVWDVLTSTWSTDDKDKVLALVGKDTIKGEVQPDDDLDPEKAEDQGTPIEGEEAPYCPRHSTIKMVPMFSGKGWRCNIPGNRYDKTIRRWSLCSCCVWKKGKKEGN